MTSKRAVCEDALIQMAQLKASYEEAEQEYKQHKDQISSIAEEADLIKVPCTSWPLDIECVCFLYVFIMANS